MFKVILVDFDGSSIELDTPDFDYSMIFKISDLYDISIRSSNRTKEISFVGNDINNAAFGHIYRLGRVSDLSLDNNLFFNTSPLREVPCLVYENNKEIFRGTLRLQEVEKDSKGIIWYRGVITDTYSDFAKTTQNKNLSDLPLQDLQHRYNITAITQSWDYQTERFSTQSSTVYYEPFEKGSGYVYCLSDYGEPILGTAGVDFNILNFRPGIYTTEIFNRIFNQDDVKLQWEFRGSDEDIERFNSQYTPNNQEKLQGVITNYQEILYGTTNSVAGSRDATVRVGGFNTSKVGLKFLTIDGQTATGSNVSSMDYTLFGKAGTGPFFIKTMYNVNNTFKASCLIEMSMTYSNPYTHSFFGAGSKNADVLLEVELIERPYFDGNYTNITDNWTVIASSGAKLLPENHIDTGGISFLIDEYEFKFNTQIALRVTDKFAYPLPNIFSLADILLGKNNSNNVQYTFSNVKVNTPKDKFSTINANVFYNSHIIPTLPTDVKQYDYIKSVMLKYNLRAFIEKENPKKLVFMTYDDFYVYCQPQNIKNFAIDWSNKVDYSNSLKQTLNSKIPMSYLFTYKEDSDFLNDDYKKRFGEIYGQFRFTDRYGVDDEKKVELVFSPTPISNQANNDMYISSFYKQSSGVNQPSKTNIRNIYYNGLKDCIGYNIVFQPPILGTDGFATASDPFTVYPEGIEYYTRYNDLTGTASQTGTFGLSRQYKISFTNDMANIPDLYNTYYINQITELTNSNLRILECNFNLNEIDIANFNPRYPIFVRTQQGNSYYKVLELNYRSSLIPTTVKLQSIFMGLER